MEFFAPASPVHILVEKATSEYLICPDWVANMQVCDLINQQEAQPSKMNVFGVESGPHKEATKALRKRIANKNPKVSLLALTLLDSCVKNGNSDFHNQVASKEFISEVVKAAHRKGEKKVSDKAAQLIESWAKAFKSQQGGRYPQFVETYVDMQNSGYVFPNENMEVSPVLTPPAYNPDGTRAYRKNLHGSVADSVKNTIGKSVGAPQGSSVRKGSDSKPSSPKLASSQESSDEKLLRDLGILKENITLLSEMLSFNSPEENFEDNEIVAELFTNLSEMSPRLQHLIGELGSHEVLPKLLDLNDELNHVMTQYKQEYKMWKEKKAGDSGGSLIDFTEEVLVVPSRPATAPAASSIPTEPSADLMSLDVVDAQQEQKIAGPVDAMFGQMNLNSASSQQPMQLGGDIGLNASVPADPSAFSLGDDDEDDDDDEDAFDLTLNKGRGSIPTAASGSGGAMDSELLIGAPLADSSHSDTGVSSTPNPAMLDLLGEEGAESKPQPAMGAPLAKGGKRGSTDSFLASLEDVAVAPSGSSEKVGQSAQEIMDDFDAFLNDGDVSNLTGAVESKPAATIDDKDIDDLLGF